MQRDQLLSNQLGGHVVWPWLLCATSFMAFRLQRGWSPHGESRGSISGQDPEPLVDGSSYFFWPRSIQKNESNIAEKGTRPIPSVEFDLLKLDVCSVRRGIGGIPGTLLGPAPVIKCGSGKFRNSMKESHLLYNIYEDFPLHVRILQDNHHIISQLYLSDIIIIPPCCWMFQGVFNLHPRWIADWGRCDGSSLSEAGWLNFRKVLTSSDFNWEQIRIQHDSSVKTLGIDTIYTSIVNHLGLLSRGDSPFPSHSPGHQLLRLCHATVIMVGWPNPGWMWFESC